MSKLNVLVRTDDYRGDHSADVAMAHEFRPAETVEELAARVLKKPTDWLEIRVIQPAPPDVREG